MSILEIINEVNLENGSNFKKSIFKKHIDNELFKRVLKMAYDKVRYSYGITMKNVVYTPESNYIEDEMSLENVLDELENEFCTRNITGNNALNRITLLLESLKKEDAIVIEKILNRDLKINIGITGINEVFGNLIIEPCYMRCDIFYNDKIKKGKLVKGTSGNIDFSAYLQLKADGTYREFKVEDSEVSCISRSGESYEYPFLFNTFKNFPNNHYMGELTVIANDEIMDRILPKIRKEDLKNDTNLAEELISQYNEAKSKNVKFILPRQIGNGLLISDDVPHENIVVELWDCVSLEEYKIAGLGEKNCETQYKTRFETLINILDDNNNEKIQVIPYIIVNNLEEAVNQTSIWMKEGFEGAILKDFKGVFKDGTSKHQLKLKIAFTLDVRIVGFIEGTKGTKREKTFASLVFETDDKMIQGSVSSGLTDKLLAEINSNREEYLSKIIEIEGNDLTQGRGNDYYAVSHPRIIEIRNDKNKTDDLERAFENLEMAKLFKDRE